MVEKIVTDFKDNGRDGSLKNLFANAMKTSGVPQILISLWDIPDEATSVAMTSFYQHLMTGVSIHEALPLTRKDLISNGYSDPYYWASFVILN